MRSSTITNSLLLLLSSILPAMAATTAETCSQLEAKFEGQVAYLQDAAYNATETEYWNKGCQLHPGCFFYPENSADVSAALTVLIKNKTKFAVKNGGHGSNIGQNNIVDGVTISTEKIRGMTWTDNNVLQVGAGHLWGEVYTEAEKRGRVAVGGRISNIGVTGLTVGGGLAFNGAKYGFAADNVHGFEVILANGKCVYATQWSLYSDLYRALKGGGNNFGIVTRIDLYTYPFNAANSWGASMMTMIGGPTVGATREQALAAIADYNIKGQKNKDTGVVISVNYFPSVAPFPLLLATMYGEGASIESDVAPKEFKGYLDLPISPPGVAYLKQGPANLSSVVADMGKDVIKGAGRNTIRVGSLIATEESIAAIYDFFIAEFEKIKDVPGLRAGLSLQPITDDFINAGFKNGGNPMGLWNNRRGPYVWVGQSIGWTNAEDDEKVWAANKRATEAYEQWGNERGLYDDFVFMNEADHTQDPFDSYGLINKVWLKFVRFKYDPSSVFQKLMPGGFKLT